MASLTNFGEFIGLVYAVGNINTISPQEAPALTKLPNGGAYIGLANLGSSSPEHAIFNDVQGPTNTIGYLKQVATFAQPTYGTADSGDERVEASNTNNLVFGPATGNWGTFTHIIINIFTPAEDTGFSNTVIAYYQLPSAVTITTGETYTIPTGTLKLALTANTSLRTFNIPTKRILLDQLLNIVDSASSLRATNLGFRSAAFAGSGTLAVLLTDAPPTNDFGTTITPNPLIPGTLDAFAVQPIQFETGEVPDRDSYIGETRVFSNLNITFSVPAEQAGSKTMTHLCLGYISTENDLIPTSGGTLIIIATRALSQPVLFNSENPVVFRENSISIALN